jgi:putative acetyltransferase
MSNVIVRELRDGEELVLRGVFYSSVHDLAAEHYTPSQISAWAPESFDVHAWTEYVRSRRTFVAEEDGEIAGYCALREDGYLDHLYVSGPHAHHGVGRQLLEHVDRVARDCGLTALESDVSVCAEPFFEHRGFSVLERRTVVVGGVAMPNARMHKDLTKSDASR